MSSPRTKRACTTSNKCASSRESLCIDTLGLYGHSEATITRKWNSLNRRVIQCELCPRLREHCAEIARKKRRAYEDWDYWGRPVPNLGDPSARVLIVGLAPGAHGANRTGRMFTGDRSGDWLFRALHRAGFANQANSESLDDGLELVDCAITATCHCAPPDNKPTTEEVANCQPFFVETVELLPIQVFVALGQIGWKAVLREAKIQGWRSGKQPDFGHGVVEQFDDGRVLIGSYHPSQQNTFTGRLTEAMLDEVFVKARSYLQ